MMRETFENLVDSLQKRDLLAVAAALLLALAIYSFLQTLVEGLIAPLISAIFSEPTIYLLSFTINGSEFGYGSVLAALILLLLAVAVVVVLVQARQAAERRSNET